MTGSDVGTWIGTAFSILGAAIAIWQARIAKTAAAHAEEMRDELTAKHEQNELSALDGILTSACRAMDKYGPGATEGRRAGVNHVADAAAVRALTAAMDRHREMLTRTLGGTCDTVRERLNALLIQFADAQAGEDRLAKGREIYQEITTLTGNMKHAIDGKVFGKDGSSAKVRVL